MDFVCRVGFFFIRISTCGCGTDCFDRDEAGLTSTLYKIGKEFGPNGLPALPASKSKSTSYGIRIPTMRQSQSLMFGIS